jgi:ABC-type multidrug transport system ATPase subunit
MTTPTPTSSPAAAATPVDAPSVVEAFDVTKVMDGRTILREVDLVVAAGESVAVIGANGAGKSTLLKILATLTPPTDGQVHLFGQDALRGGARAAALRARIGLIGHQPMLYRDLSIRENLEFFARLYTLRDPVGRAAEMMDAIALSHRANDPVKVLSRGMVQRVAIARALIHDPALVLADEPFTGLDAPSVASLEELFEQLTDAGRAVVLVNHDVGQTLRLVHRAVVLRGGRVVIDEGTETLKTGDVLAEVNR